MAKLQNILRLLLLREKNGVSLYQTAGNKFYILVQLFKSQNSASPKPSKIFLIKFIRNGLYNLKILKYIFFLKKRIEGVLGQKQSYLHFFW